MIPDWLPALSLVSLSLGFLAAAWIATDLARRPQRMWIMNVVWPATALFGHLGVVRLYRRYGRRTADARTPHGARVAKGALHCGSGGALGDIVAEWLVFLVPAVAVWFGWKSIFADPIFAVWVVDFLCAFVFGIAFQYFTIKPMRDLPVAQGLIQAVKADTASLTAWQVGMYGFMAIAHFWIFGALFAAPLRPDSAEFWFMMQIAMLAGFATACPVNGWLIRIGVKEAM